MLDDSDDIHPPFHGAPKSTEFKKLRKRIVQNVREAIDQYDMINRDAGANGASKPRWLVCLSGARTATRCLLA